MGAWIGWPFELWQEEGKKRPHESNFVRGGGTKGKELRKGSSLQQANKEYSRQRRPMDKRLLGAVREACKVFSSSCNVYVWMCMWNYKSSPEWNMSHNGKHMKAIMFVVRQKAESLKEHWGSPHKMQSHADDASHFSRPLTNMQQATNFWNLV